jgi:activator of HSP90 ATPase
MPTIHQEVTFKNATPAQVYRAFMVAAEHAKFTGAPAEISAEEGGTFACYNGAVHGRNVALVADQRIVQAWRAKGWAEGVYSIARYELTGEGNDTRLTFDQDGVPEASLVHIDAGWHRMYWEPLARHLGAASAD